MEQERLVVGSQSQSPTVTASGREVSHVGDLLKLAIADSYSYHRTFLAVIQYVDILSVT